jgi:NAD(P)-dependent dehydrogenase (short-subunit alcohol dehydrogenase family)
MISMISRDFMNDMHGKICVITGATSGIGKAAALELGRAGADLILIGRNVARGGSLLNRLGENARGGRAQFFQCDLSNQNQVRELSCRLKGSLRQVDVLINNAGARFNCFGVTADHIELTFATNYLGHFLLTALLLDLLMKADMARVINISSQAHWEGRSDFDPCAGPENYCRNTAYGSAKLAGLIFTFELAERLKGSKVRVNALHPGHVATRFAGNNGLISWMKNLGYHAWKGDLISARKGAETLVYLAASPDAAEVTGRYFYRKVPIESSPQSQSKEVARRYWEMSLKLTGLDEAMGPSWRFFHP